MTDPFGDLEKENTVEISTPAAQNNPGNEEVVATIKAGPGYDAPWLVLHALNLDDLKYELVDNYGMVEVVMRRLWAATRDFQEIGAQGKPAAPAAPAAAPAQSYGPPAGASEAPGGEVRNCVHGQMTFRAGNAKATGKPYRLFACPERDRDKQCRAQFL